MVMNSPGEPGDRLSHGRRLSAAGRASVPHDDARRGGAAHPRHAGARQRLSAAGRARLREGRAAADAARATPPSAISAKPFERKAHQVFPDAAQRSRVLEGETRRRPGGGREAAEPDPRQDDEEGRRRLRAARGGLVSADGRHEPFRAGVPARSRRWPGWTARPRARGPPRSCSTSRARRARPR